MAKRDLPVIDRRLRAHLGRPPAAGPLSFAVVLTLVASAAAASLVLPAGSPSNAPEAAAPLAPTPAAAATPQSPAGGGQSLAATPPGEEPGDEDDENAPAPDIARAAEENPIIGRITIEGNTRTSGTLIRRELGLSEGDPFVMQKLDAVWDHLEDLGYFAFVEIQTEEMRPGVIELIVTVEEDRTVRFGPLVEYDRRQKYLLGLLIADVNFRGEGEKLNLRSSLYRPQNYQLGWKRPWLFGRRDLQAELTGGWERAGFVFRPTDYSQWDAAGRVRWNFNRSFYLTFGLDYGGFEQRDTFYEHAIDRGDNAEGLVQRSAGWREHLGLTAELSWDNRDMRYYPTRGAFHSLRLRRSEGRGFDSYTEWIGDLRQFVHLPWEHVLALHVWGRQVSGPVPLEDRLFWGGPENLRGYHYASFEGEEGYLLTAEYRWPLFLMPISPQGHVVGIGLHFFTDGGDVWYDGADPGQAHWSYGAGVHLTVSSLQLRFEIARTQDGDSEFQFEDHFTF